MVNVKTSSNIFAINKTKWQNITVNKYSQFIKKQSNF